MSLAAVNDCSTSPVISPGAPSKSCGPCCLAISTTAAIVSGAATAFSFLALPPIPHRKAQRLHDTVQPPMLKTQPGQCPRLGCFIKSIEHALLIVVFTVE